MHCYITILLQKLLIFFINISKLFQNYFIYFALCYCFLFLSFPHKIVETVDNFVDNLLTSISGYTFYTFIFSAILYENFNYCYRFYDYYRKYICYIFCITDTLRDVSFCVNDALGTFSFTSLMYFGVSF